MSLINGTPVAVADPIEVMMGQAFGTPVATRAAVVLGQVDVPDSIRASASDPSELAGLEFYVVEPREPQSGEVPPSLSDAAFVVGIDSNQSHQITVPYKGVDTTVEVTLFTSPQPISKSEWASGEAQRIEETLNLETQHFDLDKFLEELCEEPPAE